MPPQVRTNSQNGYLAFATLVKPNAHCVNKIIICHFGLAVSAAHMWAKCTSAVLGYSMLIVRTKFTNYILEAYTWARWLHLRAGLQILNAYCMLSIGKE